MGEERFWCSNRWVLTAKIDDNLYVYTVGKGFWKYFGGNIRTKTGFKSQDLVLIFRIKY